MILLDGVGSEENGGTYYPFPVSKPLPGVPVVENYCPLDGSHHERAVPDIPAGLDSSLRRWSEFSVSGGSSGGSSAPEATHACDRSTKRTIPAPVPGPAPVPQPNTTGSTTSPTVTVGTIPGGFGAGACLTEALADAGAVILPYSYAGATLQPDGEFVKQSYTTDTSKQPLCSSVSQLAAEINSVHSAWTGTAIVLVGHSYGGLVAETWWFDEHQPDGGQCGIPAGASDVVHVFALDSPINGVRACLKARLYAGDASSTWCNLWGGDFSHGVINGMRIAAIDDRDLSFTAVGTPNDGTYGGGPLGGGGGLQPQLVYHCVDNSDENDPNAPCIDRTGGSLPVSYPSSSTQCDAGSGNIYATTGHDIVKTCPAVIQLVVGAIRLRAAVATATSVHTFEPWKPESSGFDHPDPGLQVTTTHGTCDSGSNDDPGRAEAWRCMGNGVGNGVPCFRMRDSGDPGSPLLCSTDPMSKQVLVLEQDGSRLPLDHANPEDPSRPPWVLLLADGKKCTYTGYGTDIGLEPYDCGGTVGAIPPDRSGPLWTVREGRFGTSTVSGPSVAVLAAYR